MSLLLVHRTGDIFATSCEALVDPVNCEGVHGKGLALEFKKRWPDAVERFSAECRKGQIEPGNVWNEHVGGSPKWILFFPTKNLWKKPSKLEYVQEGLEDLIEVVQELEIKSVAIPALGCGLGGLSWSRLVRPMIEEAAKRMLVRVEMFGPQEDS